MEAPKTPQKLGFEALTICSENDKKHQNSCLMTSNPFPPPISLPSFSHISDYIGAESCGDLMKNYQDVNDHDLANQTTYYHGKRDQRLKMKKKEYPPPMTPQPFVLKRNSTKDGRLILTKEKVERREYLEAHRSNGRLTLELVSLHHDDDEEEEKENERASEKQRGDVGGESSGVRVENDNDNVVEDEF